MTRTRIVNGNYTKIVGGDYNMYAKGNIITNAGGTITETGVKGGIIYGDPENPPLSPFILSMKWLNEAGSVIGSKEINGIVFSDYLYGEKIKVEITTKDIADGTELKIDISNNSTSIFGRYKKQFTAKVTNNKATTDLFAIMPNHYDESGEVYNYESHCTTIKPETIKQFKVLAYCDKGISDFQDDKYLLSPYTYRRNYEELIGLFSTDNTGNKSTALNYEKRFIDENQSISAMVSNFVKYISETEGLILEDINKKVAYDAKTLWDEAVKQVQGGKLDDRPLYWARNKMQAWLKRHPLFKDGIDFKKSLVKKGSELDKTIAIFEEKSRNYTGIDFSKANGKKKVLITGFDPFVLNPFHKKIVGDITTFNPSGISALYFHNKKIGNAYIQCAIVPVRYEDFDNGIIENIVENNIYQFDIMMTTSRNDSNFDLERFASKFRGGFLDNMNIGDTYLEYNQKRFKQISIGNEFYETTLPISKIMTDDLSPSYGKIYFDQSYIDDLGNKEDHPTSNSNSSEFKKIVIKGNSTNDSGSGGDYLSNEVMYRATRKRDELEKHNSKAVGHVHIADNLKPNEFLALVNKIIDNATK